MTYAKIHIRRDELVKLLGFPDDISILQTSVDDEGGISLFVSSEKDKFDKVAEGSKCRNWSLRHFLICS